MKLSAVLIPFLSLFAAGALVDGQSAPESQSVNLSEKLKIPGGSLKPGDYTFSVEDRLQDRAIVRITAQDQSKHFLVLTVPNPQLPQQGTDGLVRFTTGNGKDQVLRGWACPGCSPSLEFVYPKAEAAKLTDETAEPVLAVDPSYDKLPANLSPDDMKVVTLWLLSPERITAGNKGKGVKAEKYASSTHDAGAAQTASAIPAADATPVASATSSEVAQSPAPAAQSPVAQVAPAAGVTPSLASSSSEVGQVPTPPVAAPAAQPPDVANSTTSAATNARTGVQRLPKTASSDYLYLLGGMLLLTAAYGVRAFRHDAVSR